MKICRSLRRRQSGATRREWLVGTGVALALLATTALELRRSPGPVCGPSCSPCGSDLTAGLDRWAVSQTNTTPFPSHP